MLEVLFSVVLVFVVFASRRYKWASAPRVDVRRTRRPDDRGRMRRGVTLNTFRAPAWLALAFAIGMVAPSTIAHARPVALGQTKTTNSGTTGFENADAVRGRFATRPLYDVTHPDYGGVSGLGTNNTAAIDAAIAAANAAGGGRVLLGPGTWDYHGALEVLDDVSFDGEGATIRLILDGDHEGVQLRNDTELCNVHVTVIGSNLLGSGGQWHSPIVIGQTTGNVGYSDIIVRNVTLESDRPDANGVTLVGDSHNVLFENVDFPTSATLGRGMVVHWSGDGVNPPARTLHPHNITIRNITAGALTANTADASLIYLSAVWNVLVENVHCDEIYGSFVRHTIGDYGFKYADADVEPMAANGVVYRNATCKKTRRIGIYYDGYADDYVPATVYSAPVVFDNVRCIGDSSANMLSGIHGIQGENAVFRNCEMRGHKYGIGFQEGAKGLRVEGGRFHGNVNHGAYIEHVTEAPEDCVIVGAEFYDNGSGVATAAGVYVGQSINTVVQDCWFGGADAEANQYYGIRVDVAATAAMVRGNHVRRHKAGGVAFSMAASTAAGYAAVKLFSGNTAGSAVVTYYEGATPVPVDVKPSALGYEVRILRGGTPPIVGTWQRGDVLYREDVDPEGVIAYSCVVGGEPGTWRTLSVAFDANGRLSAEYGPTAPTFDTITERTPGAGVTVGGCLIKGGGAANALLLDGTTKAAIQAAAEATAAAALSTHAAVDAGAATRGHVLLAAALTAADPAGDLAQVGVNGVPDAPAVYVEGTMQTALDVLKANDDAIRTALNAAVTQLNEEIARRKDVEAKLQASGVLL